MRVIYHEGTGTWIDFAECIFVDVPAHITDADEIEEWLGENA